MNLSLHALRALSVACLALACRNLTAPEELKPLALNQCTSDSDCETGYCEPELAACVAKEEALPAVLLEVVPRSTDRAYGGLRFFKTLADIKSVSDAGDVNELVLAQPIRLQGGISLPIVGAPVGVTPNATCEVREAEFTFKPKESTFGLIVPPYTVSARSAFLRLTDQAIDVGRQATTIDIGAIPSGQYDLYIADPEASSVSGACGIVPQVVRGVVIRADAEAGARMTLALPEQVVRRLTVSVPFQEELLDWEVDVVHSATGERMSTRAVLTRPEPEAEGVSSVQLSVSRPIVLTGSDYAQADSEFLRLTPPDASRPTLLYVLQGLTPFDAAEATLEALQFAEDSVEYRAWIWRQADGAAPVPASVTFRATQLAEVPPSVLVQLSRKVQTNQDGEVIAKLLPGTYSVTVSPRTETGLTVFRTQIEVQTPPADSPAGWVQAGNAILVPDVVDLVGTVTASSPRGVFGVQVVAAGGLNEQRVSILAPPPFSPRPVTALVDQVGDFSLPGAGCAGCTDEASASYDIRVIPPIGSRLPWVVRPGVAVASMAKLGTIDVPAPVAKSGQLKFTLGTNINPMPEASILAYVVLNDLGEPSSSLELPRCIELAGRENVGTTERCLRSAVLIGQTTSASDANFTLFLSPRLSAQGTSSTQLDAGALDSGALDSGTLDAELTEAGAINAGAAD